MSEKRMRSRFDPDRPGRYLSVETADIESQRAQGWVDFHPEDFCHRCGYPNTSWYIDSSVWNPIMRDGNPAGWGDWAEIICIPCFTEIAESKLGQCLWRVERDENGTEALLLLGAR